MVDLVAMGSRFREAVVDTVAAGYTSDRVPIRHNERETHRDIIQGDPAFAGRQAQGYAPTTAAVVPRESFRNDILFYLMAD